VCSVEGEKRNNHNRGSGGSGDECDCDRKVSDRANCCGSSAEFVVEEN
jgi:hypothetical protein